MALKRVAYTRPWEVKKLLPWVEEREAFAEGSLWRGLEKALVPILVVVVITEMRSFRTEVEKGSRRRAIRSGLVDPKRFVKYDKKCEEFACLFPHRIEREKC